MSEQIFTIDLPVRRLGPEQDALGYHRAAGIIGAELAPCADLLGVEFWTLELSAEEEIISGLPRLIGLDDQDEPGPVRGRRAPPGLVDYLLDGTRSEFIPLMGPRDTQPSTPIEPRRPRMDARVSVPQVAWLGAPLPHPRGRSGGRGLAPSQPRRPHRRCSADGRDSPFEPRRDGRAPARPSRHRPLLHARTHAWGPSSPGPRRIRAAIHPVLKV